MSSVILDAGEVAVMQVSHPSASFVSPWAFHALPSNAHDSEVFLIVVLVDFLTSIHFI